MLQAYQAIVVIMSNSDSTDEKGLAIFHRKVWNFMLDPYIDD